MGGVGPRDNVFRGPAVALDGPVYMASVGVISLGYLAVFRHFTAFKESMTSTCRPVEKRTSTYCYVIFDGLRSATDLLNYL